MKIAQAIQAMNDMPEERIGTIESAWAKNKSVIDQNFYLVLPTCKSDEDWAYLHCKAGTTFARVAMKITSFYDLLTTLQDDDQLDHPVIASFRDYSDLVEARSPYADDLPAIGIDLEG